MAPAPLGHRPDQDPGLTAEVAKGLDIPLAALRRIPMFRDSDDPRIYWTSINGAVQIAQVSRRTIYNWRARGVIGTRYVSRRLQVRLNGLLAVGVDAENGARVDFDPE